MSDLTEKSLVPEDRDVLTGLADMYLFQREAESLQKDLRTRLNTVVFLNVEDFRRLNRTLGRDAGDSCLVFIAEQLKELFPEALISRFSDDHFVLLCKDEDLNDRLTKLHESVETWQSNFALHLKAGVYSLQEGDSVMEGVSYAGMACASIQGNDAVFVQYFEGNEGASLLTRHDIADRFDDALRNHDFEVLYQPVIRAVSGKMSSLEALVRWNLSGYGLLEPSSFLPVLKAEGEIYRLDLYVIEQVLKDLKGILDSGRNPVPVSMNLSLRDFALTDMVSAVHELMEQYGIDASLLGFEVSEKDLLRDQGGCVSLLKQLQEEGYSIILDDFGARGTALNLLRDYDFNAVKIAVTGRDVTDEKSRIVLSGIVDMAKAMDIRTLLRGVETKDQAELVMKTGIELCQGFYYEKPMSLEEVRKLTVSRETIEDMRYSDASGTWDTDEESPIALLEYREGYFSVLQMNEAFARVMGDEDSLTEKLNKNVSGMHERLASALKESKNSGKEETVELVLDGEFRTMRIRCVSSNERTGALSGRLKLEPLTTRASEDTREMALKNLTGIFDRVDLVNCDEGTVTTLLLNRERFENGFEKENVHEALSSFAENFVNPRDRENFLAFTDPEAVKEKVENGGGEYFNGLFELKDRDASYSWMQVQAVPAEIGTDKCYLLSYTSLNGEIAEMAGEVYRGGGKIQELDFMESLNEEDLMDEATLFYDLINLSGFGIFWKDRERRFVGANSAFLDYYGIESLDQLVGKTDEDMGWHVDPDPYRNDEWRVIHEGLTITGAKGSCIIHGTNREINCWKSPVYKNGKIIGLIGFFRDMTEMETGEVKSETDRLTGMLNANGIMSSYGKYQSSYRKYGIDFAIVSIRIIGLSHLNEMYGWETSDALIKKIGEMIERASGVNSVLARITADEFVCLRQVNDKEQEKKNAEVLANAISRIREIDGKQVSFNVSMDTVFYSELRQPARNNLFTQLLSMSRG